MLARLMKQPPLITMNPYFAEFLQPQDHHFYKTLTGNHCYGLPYLIILQGPPNALPDAAHYLEQTLIARIDEFATSLALTNSKKLIKQQLRTIKQYTDTLLSDVSLLSACHLSVLLTYQQDRTYCAGFNTQDIHLDLYNKEEDINKPLAPKYRQSLHPKKHTTNYFLFRSKVCPHDILFTYTRIDGITKVIHQFTMPTTAETLDARQELFKQRMRDLKNIMTVQPLLIQNIVNQIIQASIERQQHIHELPSLSRALHVVSQIIQAPEEKHITTLHELAKSLDQTAGKMVWLKAGLALLGILLIATSPMAFLIFNITACVALVLLGAIMIASVVALEIGNPHRFFGLSKALTQLAENVERIESDLPALE